jgi:hypothetical protein
VLVFVLGALPGVVVVEQDVAQGAELELAAVLDELQDVLLVVPVFAQGEPQGAVPEQGAVPDELPVVSQAELAAALAALQGEAEAQQGDFPDVLPEPRVVLRWVVLHSRDEPLLPGPVPHGPAAANEQAWQPVQYGR